LALKKKKKNYYYYYFFFKSVKSRFLTDDELVKRKQVDVANKKKIIANEKVVEKERNRLKEISNLKSEKSKIENSLKKTIQVLFIF
jgi:hypothetical protein